jgi:phage tail protein X
VQTSFAKPQPLPVLIGFEDNFHQSRLRVNQEIALQRFEFSQGISLASGIGPSCGCGAAATAAGGGDQALPTAQLIYAFGDIRCVLPSQSVEREFYNVAVTEEADKYKPFDEIAYKYLSRTENLYIARDMNWVFSIRGSIDLYILDIHTDRDLSVLIETIAPHPTTIDYDIIICHKTSQKRSETTTGEMLPVIVYQQIYNITFDQYVQAIVAANPGCTTQQAGQLFSAALQLTNNTGDEDKYRALNFLVLRYMKFYQEMYRLKFLGVDVPPGATTTTKEYYDLVGVTTNGVEVFGKKKIMEMIFTFQGQSSSSSLMYSCSVDVSREFPFIVVQWSRYYRGI